MARIVHLHRRLSHEQFVTSESLARELEVSSRTIKRDIACLRDELGAPIAWDAGTHSYTYTAHCDLLPLLRIDADEALALALAGKTFAAWRGSPLGRALTAALNKIAPIVGGAVSLPVDALSDLLFAPDDPAADAEHRHFALLLEAILRRRELRIVYQKPKAGAAAETRTIHPLHLAYLEHRWMLVAHDPSRRGIRNFVLARIGDAQPTAARFERPANFDRERYLRGSLGRFVGDTDYEVRITVDAEVAPYLRERPWHPSQKITERPNGSIEVSLRLNHLNDIERRVLACGAHAEVLAPAELRERLRRAAAALHARYA
ncbi:MAG: transcriptional regulator [Opitutaceae bacterium]|nr:transcriptional regulator [Opitutaceae bacterium]